MRTTTLVIGALLLVTFGLGSTWAIFGLPGDATSKPRAEMVVREARAAAEAAARAHTAERPVPVPMPGQEPAARLAELDAWFGEFRAQSSAESAGASGIEVDARAVATVQARAASFLELGQAYRPLTDDPDPAISARARLRLAEIHLDVADDLRELPVPGYLTPEQKVAFEKNALERVAAQEERARIELEVAQSLEERIPASSDLHAHIRALEDALPEG